MTERQWASEGKRVRSESESESGLGSVFQVAVAWEDPLSTHTSSGSGTHWLQTGSTTCQAPGTCGCIAEYWPLQRTLTRCALHCTGEDTDT